MGWAEKRIQQYNQGQPATWVEKRILEHANSLHLILALIGKALLIYGLWVHSWLWIAGGIVLNLVGHLYCWIKK